MIEGAESLFREKTDKKEPAEAITSALASIFEQKGPAGARVVIQLIQKEGHELTAKKIQENLDRIPDRTELQRLTIEYLKNWGVIEDGPNGEMIIDIEKIQLGGNLQGMKDRRKAMQPFFDCYAQEGEANFFYWALKDLKVISKEDWRSGAKEAKPLFYAPKNAEEAFGVEEIKKSDFYLGLWQVGVTQKMLEKKYPSARDSGMNEVSLACLIYHPKFGDGKRDEKGNLLVKYKNGEYRKITSDWFKNVGFTGNQKNPGESALSPRAYLPLNGQTLLKTGLLRLEDFRMKTGETRSAKHRTSRERISKNGVVMIDKIRYYIGRNFCRENIRIFRISKKIAGIMETVGGKEKLTHTFDLTTEDNPDLKSWQGGKNTYYDAGAAVTNVTEYEEAAFNLRKINENLGEHGERLSSMENFKFLLSFSNDLKNKTGNDLLSELNYEEQELAVGAAEMIRRHYEEILDYIKKNGLRSFVSLLSAEKMSDKILVISNNLDQEVARAILDKYFEIVDTVKQAGNYFRENYKQAEGYREDLVEKIIENLLARGRLLIADLASLVQEEKFKTGKIDNKKILRQLEHFKTEILLFTSAFKTVSREHPVDFSDIAGIKLEAKDSSVLTREEREEMEDIFKQNRRNYSPKLLETTLGEFKDAMKNKDGVKGRKFYLLRHDNSIITFLRFDPLPNGNLYFGSFNVRPEGRYQGIGNAMLRATFEEEGLAKTVEAVVYEKNPVLETYLKKFGFKIVGTIENYHGTGQKFYKIERPPSKEIEEAA